MKKKGSFINIILVLIFFVGLSVLLYPTISDYWNSKTQSRAIANYEKRVSSITVDDYTELFSEAENYNARLSELSQPLLEWERIDGYKNVLDITGTGIMGYIDIDKIGVELPIYHGTDASVLTVAVGHLEGSSLPIGGSGTHTVLSAHRGLPSAKLFTDLDRLEVGDTFRITVLNQVYVYRVEQIHIVEPEDIELLQPVPGKEYCTLMTCTPYGINTHRLLVRGERVDTEVEKNVYVSSEAFRIDPIIVTPVVAAPMLLVLLVWLLIKYRKNVEREERHETYTQNTAFFPRGVAAVAVCCCICCAADRLRAHNAA